MNLHIQMINTCESQSQRFASKTMTCYLLGVRLSRCWKNMSAASGKCTLPLLLDGFGDKSEDRIRKETIRQVNNELDWNCTCRNSPTRFVITLDKSIIGYCIRAECGGTKANINREEFRPRWHPSEDWSTTILNDCSVVWNSA
jgi:hypothetical protein